MKSRFVAVVLAVVCMVMGWKLWGKAQEQQPQQSIPIYTGNQGLSMNDGDL